MVQTEGGAALREQQEYYASRAAEYDDAYRRTGEYDRGRDANARWQADLALLVDAFGKVRLSGDVVELAAGTGFWTVRIVDRVRSLSVIDGSADMVAMNRERLGPAAARLDYQRRRHSRHVQRHGKQQAQQSVQVADRRLHL